MASESATPSRYVPDDRKFEDRDWLFRQYWVEERTTTDIAAECGVTHETIAAHMREMDIPRRSVGWNRAAGEYDPRDDWQLDDGAEQRDGSDRTDGVDWAAIAGGDAGGQ